MRLAVKVEEAVGKVEERPVFLRGPFFSGWMACTESGLPFHSGRSLHNTWWGCSITSNISPISSPSCIIWYPSSEMEAVFAAYLLKSSSASHTSSGSGRVPLHGMLRLPVRGKFPPHFLPGQIG